MNAAAAAKPPVAPKVSKDHRERQHRFSKLLVKDLITLRMSELGMKNTELAAALDYPMPNVVAMMKSGSMRIPEGKVIQAADALQVDRAMLLRKVLTENNATLWDVIDKVVGPKIVTENERALLVLVRDKLDGLEIDLTKSEAFVQAVSPVLEGIVKRETAVNEAAIKRIKLQGE